MICMVMSKLMEKSWKAEWADFPRGYKENAGFMETWKTWNPIDTPPLRFPFSMNLQNNPNFRVTMRNLLMEKVSMNFHVFHEFRVEGSAMKHRRLQGNARRNDVAEAIMSALDGGALTRAHLYRAIYDAPTRVGVSEFVRELKALRRAGIVRVAGAIDPNQLIDLTPEWRS